MKDMKSQRRVRWSEKKKVYRENWAKLDFEAKVEKVFWPFLKIVQFVVFMDFEK